MGVYHIDKFDLESVTSDLLDALEPLHNDAY